MKKLFLILAAMLSFSAAVVAEDKTDAVVTEQAKKKIIKGFEGGVLFNTGCYWVQFSAPVVAGNYIGCPLGVGGFGRLGLGEHFHVGGGGYMNTGTIRMDKDDRNGSETIHAFGGVMADVYATFGRFRPYAGFLIGAGILKHNVMNSKISGGDFVESHSTKSFVWSADPMVGCQIKLFGRIHLMVQLSYTAPFNKIHYEQFHGLGTRIGLVFGD